VKTFVVGNIALVVGWCCGAFAASNHHWDERLPGQLAAFLVVLAGLNLIPLGVAIRREL
jgi:hypothetical protein